MFYPKELEEVEPIWEEQLAAVSGSDIAYEVGRIGTKFFAELRDNKKIFGIRCPVCDLVYMPPRLSCKNCFTELKEWVEVSDTGTLLTYTIVYVPGENQPFEPPYAIGLIQLDGADTALMHVIGEIDLEKLSIGMRLRAVFSEEQDANIRDIKYFKPL